MNISTRLPMTLLAGLLLLHPSLVSRPLASEAVPAQYFNTGTFVKQQGRWQAVAWQATRIPDIENDFASHRAGERVMLLP